MVNFWILNQLKGNNSCTTAASMIKLNKLISLCYENINLVSAEFVNSKLIQGHKFIHY